MQIRKAHCVPRAIKGIVPQSTIASLPTEIVPNSKRPILKLFLPWLLPLAPWFASEMVLKAKDCWNLQTVNRPRPCYFLLVASRPVPHSTHLRCATRSSPSSHPFHILFFTTSRSRRASELFFKKPSPKTPGTNCPTPSSNFHYTSLNNPLIQFDNMLI